MTFNYCLSNNSLTYVKNDVTLLYTNSDIYVRNDTKLLPPNVQHVSEMTLNYCLNIASHFSPKRLQTTKRGNATERFAEIQKPTCIR